MQAATAGVPQHGPWAVSQRNRKMQSNVNSCLGCAVLLQLLSGIKDGNELPVEEDVHLSLPVPCANGEVQVHSVRRPAPPDSCLPRGTAQDGLKSHFFLFFSPFFFFGLLLFEIRWRRKRRVYLLKQLKATLPLCGTFFHGQNVRLLLCFPFILFSPPRILLINSPR